MPASEGSPRSVRQPGATAGLGAASGKGSACIPGARASIRARLRRFDFIATHLQVHLDCMFRELSGSGWVWPYPGPTMAADRQRKNNVMSATDHTPRLPPTFNRLAWSNLAAQSAEQIALAPAPIVAGFLPRGGPGPPRPLPTPLPRPVLRLC